VGIRLEGLRKAKKNLCQDSRSPGRDMNPGPIEHEAGVLTTQPRRSVASLYFLPLHELGGVTNMGCS
jgi:hypothetical protein